MSNRFINHPLLSLLFITAPACVGDAPALPGETDATATTGSMSADDADEADASSTGGADDSGSSTMDGGGGVEPVCGNGVVDDGEACDDGQANGLYGGCATDCSGIGTFCGDGVVQPQEHCDDGNSLGGDDCNALCREPGKPLWTVTLPATPGYRVLDAEPTNDGGLFLVGARFMGTTAVAWSGHLNVHGELAGERVYATANSAPFDEVEPLANGWVASTEVWADLAFLAEDGTLTQTVPGVETNKLRHTMAAAINGHIVRASRNPGDPIFEPLTRFSLISAANPSIEIATFERPEAARPAPDEDGYVYVASLTEDGDVVLEKLGIDGQILWATSDSLQLSASLRYARLFLDAQGGLLMVGDAFPGDVTDLRIRRYNRENGNIMLDEPIAADSLGKCDAEAEHLVCLVRKSDEPFVQKYDLAGTLVWERALEADVHADYEDGLAVAATGITFIWNSNPDHTVDISMLAQ